MMCLNHFGCAWRLRTWSNGYLKIIKEINQSSCAVSQNSLFLKAQNRSETFVGYQAIIRCEDAFLIGSLDRFVPRDDAR